DLWSPDLTDIDDSEGTGVATVAYLVRFRAQLEDPSYTVPYDVLEIIVYVDVFTGELVGGDYFKEFVIGE
ncbi:MAG: hypothetical protein ACE5JL_03375, partial [Dehalococcoidia bacterium]